MRISVIINNYNYSKYIIAALRSVENQTFKAHEVIIVDDGSSDNSLEILRDFCTKKENFTIIAQENQGQLSAILNGILASEGDLICLLDADDEYEVNHLELVLNTFRDHPHVGMRFCDVQEIGKKTSTSRFVPYHGDLGKTAMLTYLTADFTGNVTSSLAFKSDTLRKLVPFLKTFEPDWFTRADNCLIWASSLAGFCFFNAQDASVKYRVHGNNLFSGATEDPRQRWDYIAKREWFIQKISTDVRFSPASLKWLYREYETSCIKKPARFKKYRRAIFSFRNPHPWNKKVSLLFKLIFSHLRK